MIGLLNPSFEAVFHLKSTEFQVKPKRIHATAVISKPHESAEID